MRTVAGMIIICAMISCQSPPEAEKAAVSSPKVFQVFERPGEEGESWRHPLPRVEDFLGKAPMEEGFRNPPRMCSMLPFWSWNSTLEPDKIRWQIDQFVDKGLYGAFMHAREGLDNSETPYFSKGFWDAVKVSVEHGRAKNFYAWIYDEDKWPSGSAGGRTVERNPERNVAKKLTIQEKRVEGPAQIELPDSLYIVAGKLTGKDPLDAQTLVNLSGQKKWDCPDGAWMMMSYKQETSRGGTTGSESPIRPNYLNKQTVRDFIDITHEQYAKLVGKEFGKTVPGIFFDEISNEREGLVWEDQFAEHFRRIKGYDLIPWLPALTKDIGPKTPKIRCDYFDVYATLLEDAWFKQLTEWCDQHNLMLTGHTLETLQQYWPEADYWRTIRNLQIPMTDHEDFRYEYPREIKIWKNVQIASICNLYEKPLVGVECMGGAGWSFTLDSARYGFNLLAAHGINFFVPHLFHYEMDRPENVADWPNSWFYQNPYWKYFKPLSEHVSRLTYMLIGTERVKDVAVLHPITDLWAGNDGGTIEKTVPMLTLEHIAYDMMDPDSLLRAELKDGCLVVGPMRYRVLVLPALQCVRRPVADKIKAFIEAGGALIVHDRWPSDSMEEGRDDAYIKQLQQAGEAKGIKPTPLSETVKLILAAVDRDIEVSGERPDQLRYHHHRRSGRDIYLVANNAWEPLNWRVSFRAIGTPSLWQPEDGSITPITAFVNRGQRTEMNIALDARQAYFVVFDPAKPTRTGGVELAVTNLQRPQVASWDEQSVCVQGWLPPDQKQASFGCKVYDGTNVQPVVELQPMEAGPQAVNLDGEWQFLPLGDQLDYDWRIDVDRSELELPVMHVRWELGEDGEALGWQKADFNARRWRQIKVFDKFHPNEGAARYRSRWLGRFIAFYEYSDPRSWQFVEHRGPLHCRTTFRLPRGGARAKGWLAVICESPFTLKVNNQEYKGQGGKQAERFELKGLKQGINTINIVAENTMNVLADGRITLPNGRSRLLFTDATWKVSPDGQKWIPAWEYIAPPEKPYGEPEYPEAAPMPDVVWYRQALPPGTTAIHSPKIEGQWQAWLNGEPLNFADGKATIAGDNQAAVLAIRVTLAEGQHGLLEPLRVCCTPSARPLGSWTEQNLAWYSGKAMYSKTFQLEPACKKDDVRLCLDLGKVCWCAEIWVNGKLAGTRIWPPYRLDITAFAKEGENRIDIVIANLLANRMLWDIFDDVKGNKWNRNWQDGNILRDAWCLESGLVGPVRVLPMRKVSLTAKAK